LARILPVFDSILWFSVPIPHWNNGFCQRWSLSGLPLDIRRKSKFSTGYGCPKSGSEPDAVKDRLCDLKRFIWYFEDSGCKTKFGNFWPLGESCTLLNHLFIIFGSIFQFFRPFRVYLRIVKDTLLDSFPIRTVRFEPQQESDTTVIFWKQDRIG